MKKNSSEDENIRKKKTNKCFEEKGTVRNAKKNRTSMKSWVEEHLSKFRKNVYAKQTVEKSHLCKAGLLFLQ